MRTFVSQTCLLVFFSFFLYLLHFDFDFDFGGKGMDDARYFYERAVIFFGFWWLCADVPCVRGVCVHFCVRVCVRAFVYFFFVLAYESAKHAFRLRTSPSMLGCLQRGVRARERREKEQGRGRETEKERGKGKAGARKRKEEGRGGERRE